MEIQRRLPPSAETEAPKAPNVESEQSQESLESQIHAIKQSFVANFESHTQKVAERLQTDNQAEIQKAIREEWKEYAIESGVDPSNEDFPFDLMECDRELQKMVELAGEKIRLAYIEKNGTPETGMIVEDGDGYAVRIDGGDPIKITSKKHFGKKYLGDNQGKFTRVIIFTKLDGTKVAEVVGAPSVNTASGEGNNHTSIDFVADKVVEAGIEPEIVDDPGVEEAVAQEVSSEVVPDGELTVSEQRQEYAEKLEKMQEEIYVFSEIISDKITHDYIQSELAKIAVNSIGEGVDVLNHPVMQKWFLEAKRINGKIEIMLQGVGYEGEVPKDSTELTQFIVKSWIEKDFTKGERQRFMKDLNDRMTESTRRKKTEVYQEMQSDLAANPDNVSFDRDEKKPSKEEYLVDAQDIIEKVQRIKALRENGLNDSLEGIYTLELRSLLNNLESNTENTSFAEQFNRDYSAELESVIQNEDLVGQLIQLIEGKIGEPLAKDDKAQLEATLVRSQNEIQKEKEESDNLEKVDPSIESAEKVGKNIVRFVNNIYVTAKKIEVYQETVRVLESQQESFSEEVYQKLHAEYTRQLEMSVDTLGDWVEQIKEIDFIDGESLTVSDFSENITESPVEIASQMLAKVEDLPSITTKIEEVKSSLQGSDGAVEKLKVEIRSVISENLEGNLETEQAAEKAESSWWDAVSYQSQIIVLEAQLEALGDGNDDEKQKIQEQINQYAEARNQALQGFQEVTGLGLAPDVLDILQDGEEVRQNVIDLMESAEFENKEAVLEAFKALDVSALVDQFFSDYAELQPDGFGEEVELDEEDFETIKTIDELETLTNDDIEALETSARLYELYVEITVLESIKDDILPENIDEYTQKITALTDELGAYKYIVKGDDKEAKKVARRRAKNSLPDQVEGNRLKPDANGFLNEEFNSIDRSQVEAEARAKYCELSQESPESDVEQAREKMRHAMENAKKVYTFERVREVLGRRWMSLDKNLAYQVLATRNGLLHEFWDEGFDEGKGVTFDESPLASHHYSFEGIMEGYAMWREDVADVYNEFKSEFATLEAEIDKEAEALFQSTGGDQFNDPWAVEDQQKFVQHFLDKYGIDLAEASIESDVEEEPVVELAEDEEAVLTDIEESLGSAAEVAESDEIEDLKVRLEEQQAQLESLLRDLDEEEDSAKKRQIEADIKNTKESIYQTKLQIEALRNRDFIDSQKEKLTQLKQEINAKLEGNEDASDLQKEYEKIFKETVNILGGLHLTNELQDLFKVELQDTYEFSIEEKAAENKAMQAARKIRDAWKKTPWYAKAGLGVVATGLTFTGAPPLIAAGMAGGAALKTVRFASSFMAGFEFSMGRANNIRVNRLKRDIENALKNPDSSITVEEFGKLLGEMHVVHALHGDKVVSKESYDKLVTKASAEFAKTAENQVKVRNEENLESFIENKVNVRKSDENSDILEKSNAGVNETEASKLVEVTSTYKANAEKEYKKSLGQRRTAAIMGGAAAGLTLAFGGEAFGAITSGAESASEVVDGVSFSEVEAPIESADGVLRTDLGEVVSDTAPQAYAESGAPGIVGDIVNEDTLVTRAGDVEVGNIIDTLKQNYPEDITKFSSGDTVSGEIMSIMKESGTYVDAEIAADKAYDFLTSDVGRPQLYELVVQNQVGQEKLAQMGYDSLDSFMTSDLSYDQVMELSRYMETGDLIGLEASLDGFSLEEYGILSEAEVVEAPILQTEAVTFNPSRGVITEINYDKLAGQVTPEEITKNITSLPDHNDLVPSASGVRLTDKIRFLVSEGLGTRLDQVDVNVAFDVGNEYFFNGQGTEGITTLYESVMSIPEDQIPANTDLSSLRAIFEQVGEDPTGESLKEALSTGRGSDFIAPNDKMRMVKINSAISQITRINRSSIQLPGLRTAIAQAITNRMN